MYVKTLALFSILALCTLSQAPLPSQQTFFTGGGCPSIPGIGSPILMIANARKYIDDGLNIKNDYTQVKFISYNQLAATTVAGSSIYRLAFTLTDYYSTKYIGIEIAVSSFGIGAVVINRFMITNNLAALNKYIDSTVTGTAILSCGDLKFVYSSYGNSPTSPLDYLYPGRNFQSAGLKILNNLNSNSGSGTTLSKTCVTANFIETSNFFGTAGTGTATDLLNCLPNKNAIAAIDVGCVSNAVSSLQLVYNDLNDNGTTNSPLVGNQATPASDITTIPLTNVSRISFTSTTTPNSINIQTLDANGNVLTNYTCGTGTTSPTNVIITESNFLGLTGITTDGTVIQSFQITQYNQNTA